MHVNSRAVRAHIASAFAGFAISSFIAHLILFFIYFSSAPKVPDPALGRVQALNNHGSFVYISQSEATGLSLLMISFLVWGVMAASVAPKITVIAPPAQFALVRVIARTGDLAPSGWLTMVFSGLMYAAFIGLYGKAVAQYATGIGLRLSGW